MNLDKLNKMTAGLEKWQENFGQGMERRGADGLSWYDLSINCNSTPHDAKIAIIVTSYWGQLKWLKATLSAYRQVPGAFVILAYDNPFYAWVPKNPHDMHRTMPNPDHYLLAHAVVHKHITYDSDKRNGWYWDVRYAQGIIKQFPNIKHVYMTNGDCICEKPEGFAEIIELLGDGDLMAGQSDNGLVHTADVIFKVDAFHRIFDWIAEVMRVPVLGSRSPEGNLRDAITALNMKLVHAPLQGLDPEGPTVDWYSRFGQDSTWKRVLGYRNLFAEYETLGNFGMEPLPAKYVDSYMDWLYFGGEERETICQFWATGDRRYLYMWLDRWEDSWYNRLYTDVNYWSPVPVFDKAQDALIYPTKFKEMSDVFAK